MMTRAAFSKVKGVRLQFWGTITGYLEKKKKKKREGTLSQVFPGNMKCVFSQISALTLQAILLNSQLTSGNGLGGTSTALSV